MRKVMFVLVAFLCFSSCSVTSNTIINGNKTFELGEGRHGSYLAIIKNVSKTPVEIYEADLDGQEQFNAVIKPGQKLSLNVQANKKVLFKNKTRETASLHLVIKGNVSGLSMGGANY